MHILSEQGLISNPVTITKSSSWLTVLALDAFYTLFHYSGFSMLYLAFWQPFILIYAIPWLVFSIFHHIMLMKGFEASIFAKKQTNEKKEDLHNHFQRLREKNSIKLNRDLFIQNGVADETAELCFVNLPNFLRVNYKLEILFADEESRIAYEEIIDGRKVTPVVGCKKQRLIWKYYSIYRSGQPPQWLYYVLLVFCLEFLMVLKYRETIYTIEIRKRLKSPVLTLAS